MPPVLHFRRQLFRPPDAAGVPGISVRNISIPDDVEAWLALRDRAMADQTPHVRPWSRADFYSEMQSKIWWRTDRNWLAIADETASIVGAEQTRARGGCVRRTWIQ